MTLEQLRVLFAVLEQQRADKNYHETLGKPDFERFRANQAIQGE